MITTSLSGRDVHKSDVINQTVFCFPAEGRADGAEINLSKSFWDLSVVGEVFQRGHVWPIDTGGKMVPPTCLQS